MQQFEMRLRVLACREATRSEQAHSNDYRLATNPCLLEHHMATMHHPAPVVKTSVAMQDREVRVVAANGDCATHESDFLIDLQRRPVLIGPFWPARVYHHVIAQPACSAGAD